MLKYVFTLNSMYWEFLSNLFRFLAIIRNILLPSLFWYTSFVTFRNERFLHAEWLCVDKFKLPRTFNILYSIIYKVFCQGSNNKIGIILRYYKSGFLFVFWKSICLFSMRKWYLLIILKSISILAYINATYDIMWNRITKSLQN